MKKVALSILLFSASSAYSSGISLKAGPPALGRGGPNPISLSPVDFAISYITDGHFESSISATGILFGQRMQAKWGGYVSLGGGIIIGGLGVGLGPYSAFGMDWGTESWGTNMEYVQAIGVTGRGLTSPYAVRLGATKWF